MQKIFDAHLHLWDLDKMPISWLKGNEKLEQNYDFFRAKEEYEGFEFLGAMYVETNSDDLEKEALFALEQKKLHNLLLCLADLKYKEELSSFREVMHTSKKEAKRLFEADFEEKIEILKTFNIPFEACMKNEELSFLEKFLNKNPNLKVVLNHLGSPKIDRLNEYKKDLNLLKKFPNLYIKLSVPDDFSEQTSKEFIYELFAFFKENFSEDKFIFGSNYPVAKIAPAKWAKLIIESKIFKNLNKIFYQNALSIYKEDRCKDMVKS
ncbi:TPA: amidohydrolase family protein [Campylobacter coli]|uniref:amidohydrolase family protein n=1 Tax=Campylobacter coli TaxID=195 RepID=UPI0007082BCC|nr:amidohydrolase family protein [Campylobacter coli]EAH6871873.1 amidohydrolase [Campylobacter coli]EAH9406133.1 amidohydrolase [Campylobacter coli]EAI3771001.1 amidohydrolase [Campylobacter coli]EAI4819026.1 amidohydrolase [Campylobacter coli]EAJ0294119.1 amidohydrolase [Campylobacter coli]